MDSASLTPTAEPAESFAPGNKGLKSGAIGFVSNVVISVASVAPAYSLAATLGFVVAVTGVGRSSPAILLVSFIPMLLVATGYKYLNRADPDCGTTFAWATRAFGPHAGWMGGWGIIISDIIVMAALAQVAGTYTFLLFRHTPSTLLVTIAGVVWIVLMTWIVYIGIELSARTQRFLLTLEVLTLAAFAIVALIKVYANNPHGSIHPAFSWVNPFQISSTHALIGGVLLGLFIYWGWDTGVTVNEESEHATESPGRAAVMSTLLLLAIYVVVSIAAQAYAGTAALANPSNQGDVLQFLGGKVFPRPLDLLMVFCVLTSASASTQTTILPQARTTLSMARWGAIPRVFGKVHPRHQTPHVSTIAMGVVSVIWYVAIVNLSQNVLSDSITALGFMIAFYYGITGFACAWYFRRELFKSIRNFVFVGLAPTVGGLLLLLIFIRAANDYGKQVNNYSPDAFGIGLADVIGIGGLLLGVVVMFMAMFSHRDFFRRRAEIAPPGVLEGEPTPLATESVI
jgi:amino acid transporter